MLTAHALRGQWSEPGGAPQSMGVGLPGARPLPFTTRNARWPRYFTIQTPTRAPSDIARATMCT
jgi:hypothetical protein